jgi:DNA polymerase-3 subunit epsilon
MRQLIIDTETTGLNPQQGHRIIEFAALEVVDRRATGNSIHYRVDPERDIDPGATEVHGMTWEDLKGQPKFRDVASEFALARMRPCAEIHAGVIDTLALAREMFPGKRNNLDALCERFGISNAQRTLHGALLDAELLAEVYLAMTRGQDALTIDIAAPAGLADAAAAAAGALSPGHRAPLRVIEPTDAELAAHADYLAALDAESGRRCLWLRSAGGEPGGGDGEGGRHAP